MPKTYIFNNLKQALGIYTNRFLLAKINITIYGNYKIIYDDYGGVFFNVFILPGDSNEESPICKIHLEPFFMFPYERIYLDYFNCNIVFLKNPKTNLTLPRDTDGGYIAGDAVFLITRGW
jgi:hypothetical protein